MDSVNQEPCATGTSSFTSDTTIITSDRSRSIIHNELHQMIKILGYDDGVEIAKKTIQDIIDREYDIYSIPMNKLHLFIHSRKYLIQN